MGAPAAAALGVLAAVTGSYWLACEVYLGPVMGTRRAAWKRNNPGASYRAYGVDRDRAALAGPLTPFTLWIVSLRKGY